MKKILYEFLLFFIFPTDWHEYITFFPLPRLIWTQIQNCCIWTAEFKTAEFKSAVKLLNSDPNCWIQIETAEFRSKLLNSDPNCWIQNCWIQNCCIQNCWIQNFWIQNFWIQNCLIQQPYMHCTSPSQLVATYSSFWYVFHACPHLKKCDIVRFAYQTDYSEKSFYLELYFYSLIVQATETNYYFHGSS